MRPGAWIARFGPAVVVMAVIFLASSIPSAQMPHVGSWDVILKKGGHMTGYALLALSLVRGQGKTGWKAYLLVWIGCLLYAVSDEFHQSFVSGRNPAPTDVGIDLVGSFIGLWLIARSQSMRRVIMIQRK
jgi:VanZ family protein